MKVKVLLYEAQKNNNLPQARGISFDTMIANDGMVGQIIAFHLDLQTKEISYCNNPKYSGRGLATEGANLAIDHLGGEFEATAPPENIASQRVLAKLGFAIDEPRKGVNKFGQTQDYWVKSIEHEPTLKVGLPQIAK